MDGQTKAKRGPKGPLTDEHKQAMIAGRTETAAVRTYLDLLRSNKPRRGRKRTRESVETRLLQIAADLAYGVSPIDELHLTQERLNLQAELNAMDLDDGLKAALAGFADHAASYGRRNGITYAAWRHVGVPAEALESAGISR